MEIIEYTDRFESQWKVYLTEKEFSTFAHQIEWKAVLEKSFKQKPVYLLAKDGDRVVGILPLFYYSSVLFGKFLISLPWLDYGGVCSDSDEVQEKLIDKDWDKFLDLCKDVDPSVADWKDSTVKKIRQVMFRILAEAKYIDSTNSRKLLPVTIVPEVRKYLINHEEEYVLRCMEVTQ